MADVVVLTGATGLIGTALAQAFVASGREVRGLARRPEKAAAKQPQVRWFAGDLEAAVDPAVWQGATVLVHLAWIQEAGNPELVARTNIAAAERLFAAAQAAGVRQRVFVSSMSSHPRALSWYGRSKLQVESLLDPTVDLVVRPGFVVGPGGVFARLARSLRALPVIPSFYGGNKPIQTIAVDDLVAALVRAVDRQLTGSLTLAHPVSLTTDAFYRAVLRASGARPRPVLRLPGSLVLPLLQCAEALRLPLPMNSENLRGLQALEATDTRNDLLRLGLTLKSCDEALTMVNWSQV